MNAPEQPVMIQENEVDADLCLARNFERSVDVREEPIVKTSRQSAIVVGDARPSIAEHEPSRDGEAETRDVVEIARNGVATRGHAQVRSPDVGAEVETVEDRAAIRGPGVVDTVHERQMYPRSRAFSTARVRSRTPSFDRMLEAWFLIVPSAVPSASAISRLL